MELIVFYPVLYDHKLLLADINEIWFVGSG